jgi:hypothetical protein
VRRSAAELGGLNGLEDRRLKLRTTKSIWGAGGAIA